MSTANEEEILIDEASSGNEQALAQLFERHRHRLRKMVLLRLDQRVQARFDASDVVQEAFVEAARKLAEYGKDQNIPFFLWLRMITGERLIQLHRMHLGATKRNADREVSLNKAAIPEASSVYLASQLIGTFTSVDRNIIRVEVQQKLQVMLNQLDLEDREVIAMRHFEELSTEEIATVLGLTRSGVLKKYTRAVRRLREAISNSGLEVI